MPSRHDEKGGDGHSIAASSVTLAAWSSSWVKSDAGGLIKTGGRLVRHARRLVFQLAEVLVTREMLTGILERISRLRLAPG